MTSIERAAYPRFGRLVSARELAGLSPSADGVQPEVKASLGAPWLLHLNAMASQLRGR